MKIDLDGYLKEKIKKKGYDFDFIYFLVDYFLDEFKPVEISPAGFAIDEAHRKKAIRAFRKEGEPDELIFIKKILKKPGRKAFRPIAMKNKYGYYHSQDPKRGRPKNENFWALVYCLKAYLESWHLISCILYAVQKEDGTRLIKGKWEEDTLRSEWCRQEHTFKYFNAEGVLENLRSTYKMLAHEEKEA